MDLFFCTNSHGEMTHLRMWGFCGTGMTKAWVTDGLLDL